MVKSSLLIIGLVIVGIVLINVTQNSSNKNVTAVTPTIKKELPPLVKKAQRRDAYTILFIGDSMTKALGPDSTELRKDLKDHYPKTVFGIFNYSKGSTNVLSVRDVLNKDTILEDRQMQSVLSREFEVIFIESFGHNPLSEYPLADGLKKQTEELDYIVQTLRENKPNSIIVFLTPIAPNRENYAKSRRDLTQEMRNQWVDERLAYIENHIKYAKDHDLLLLDLFNKSKDETGNGKKELIDQSDYIHPSAKGVEFMSENIADFLYEQEILPE